MNYYLIEICSGDAKIAGKAIYEFASQKEALASYHGKISTAMKSDLYKKQQILIINEEDIIIADNIYINENYPDSEEPSEE